jgi:RimJ/RimL family protein N-acetyltransferase
MRSREDFWKRIDPYRIHYIYEDDLGYIAWMYGTGDNVEFLFLEGARAGCGRELYRRALIKMESVSPTYHSLYAFTKTDNHAAINFYTKMGWKRHDLGESIYHKGETTLFTVELEALKKVLFLK